MFHAAKDALASEAARRYFNNLIARYGKVEELRIDSRNQTMKIVCLLEGEAQPITIHVDDYAILTVDSKKMLQIGTCRCSRPWVESLLVDFVRGRTIELPGWAAAAL
jgi:hypothetical protein